MKKIISSKTALNSGLLGMFFFMCLSSPIIWADKAQAPSLGFVDHPNSIVYNARQLSFVGPRSGEGYFNQDGTELIFQSEREPGNPFYQMYRLELGSGKLTRLSPGSGKTTCGWFNPNGKEVLFSSTHLDPEIAQKNKEELELRKKPVKGRYAWSFDDKFDIFVSDLEGKHLRQLTHEHGYDAEASYSPDGKWIAFASNRKAYVDSVKTDLTTDEYKVFQQDPSYMMDIYLMKSDGSQVRQLTTERGYDGGPFFSPDGKKIVWRHFNTAGTIAEVWTMDLDGQNKRQITHLNSMSWAPFFHPTGDYIIFASSVLGYTNFELYVVDSKGEKEPVRVTFMDGFDGLASFSPAGRKVTWAHKNEKGDSQIYLADWNDAQARQELHLPPPVPQLKNLIANQQENLKSWIQYLASTELEGRRAGSEQETSYQSVIVQYFKDLGLVGGASDGSFYDRFEFTSGVHLGKENFLEFVGAYAKKLQVVRDYVPLSFSQKGEFKESPIVFAGYGISAPGTDQQVGYDSYRDLDVQGKWVIVFQDIPQNISKERRLHLQFYAHPHHKVRVAKNHGALGLILMKGPEALQQDAADENYTDKLKLDGSRSDVDLAVLNMKTAVAQDLFSKNGLDLKSLQTRLDKGEILDKSEGMTFPSLYLRGRIDLAFEKSMGANIIAKLPGALGASGRANKKDNKNNKNNSKSTDKNIDLNGVANNDSLKNTIKTPGAIIIGAHGDHLGHGENGNSLAKGDEKGHIHFGADDNASGVAGVLELAQFFVAAKKTDGNNAHFGRVAKSPQINKQANKFKDIYFAVWSGEEIGVLGSTHFVHSFQKPAETFESYFNMDMIGRLKEKLYIQGVGSGGEWTRMVETLALAQGLPLQIQEDPYLPTDSMAFYMAEIPTVNFFTGVHEDYHSPRDTADKINYAGEVQVLQTVKKMVEISAGTRGRAVQYQKTSSEQNKKLEGRSFRIYLGSIPDYTVDGLKGVKISGTTKGSPAEKAGLVAGDVIVEFDGQKIENIYDYVYALQVAKANRETQMKVLRKADTLEVKIIPQLKE